MIDFITRQLALIVKELLAVLRDGKSRVAVIVPPVIQICLFGYAATLDVNTVPYALQDLDHSQWSRMYAADLDGSGIFHRVATVSSNRELDELMARKEIVLAVTIPRNFAREVEQGCTGSIQMIADGRNSNTAGIALSYAREIASAFNYRHLPQTENAVPNVRIESRAWFNPNMITRVFMIPCLLAVLALLDTVLSSSLSIAREREEGTFDQLLVAPYRPSEIILGKGLATMAISCVQSTCVLLIILYWFKIPFQGSYWLLALAMFLFIMTSAAIGLCISSYSKSLQQAIVGTFLLVVPMVMLSGFATPIESMPEFFQDLTLLNPMRYGMTIMQRIFLEGAGLAELWDQFLVVFGIAFISIAASLVAFRKQVG